MKNNRFFFYCIIESDLIILSSISYLLIEKGFETYLIVSNHPRTINIYENYKKFFSHIILVPYHTFTYNLWKIFSYYNMVKEKLNRYNISSNDTLIIFDIFELLDIILYKYFRSIRARIINISAFECNEFDPTKREIVFSGTLVQSIASIILLKKIFYEYKVKNTNFRWLRHLNNINVDLQLCIQKSKFRTKNNLILYNLPYPGILISKFIDFDLDILNTLNDYEVIFLLVNSQLKIHLKNYNNIIYNILFRLQKIYPDKKIVIKDHPNYSKKNYLDNMNNIIILNNKISAEKFFLKYYKKIWCVISYGSTSLLIASWLGIKSLNISELMGFNRALVSHYKNFMEFGTNIYNITHIDEINFIIKSNEINERPLDSEEIKKIWFTIINKYFI